MYGRVKDKKEKNSMELWEAVKALQEGKKVRGKSWSSYEYIFLNNGVLVDETGDPLRNVNEVLFARSGDCWETYKEGWQNVETKNIWDLPEGVTDMAQITAANCPYCDKKIVTLRMLSDCTYCPYCGRKVIK
jgi:hypothetical protein